MNINEFKKCLIEGACDEALMKLYGSDSSILETQRNRYLKAVNSFEKTYGGSDIEVFSASGRTEIGGNHTDHQHGCVLAAAVDVDAIAITSFNDSSVMRILSEGYREVKVDINDLGVHENEGGTVALVRGVASKMTELGVKLQGFDMYVTSDVLGGSGISSSAAFETLVGTAIDKHCNSGKLGAVEIAKIGQFAENVYFNKKSGLMDQTVSSVGGFVYIDFCDTSRPEIESCTFDFEKAGYALFITDTKGSHADLNDDYSAITSEMKSVAAYFGKDVLREVDTDEFWRSIPALRKSCSDRAIMRAIHFFEENLRPKKELDALKKGDVDEFLKLVNESGESSERLLQNLFSTKKPTNQEISLGLAVSRRILDGRGASRVHGGGFAGTIQAFVPLELAKDYKNALDGLFGEGSCRQMRIRPAGGISFFEFVGLE